MTKKLLAAVLFTAMLICFAACAHQNDPGKTDTDTAKTNTADTDGTKTNVFDTTLTNGTSADSTATNEIKDRKSVV